MTAKGSTPASTPYRVLVVEDERLNSRLFRTLLEREGHSVVEASSVSTAIARLDELAPHLALVDLRIPGGGGLAVLQYIRQNDALKKIAVVAVTGEGEEAELLAAGFDGFFAKPIDVRAFASDVGTLLRTRPVHSNVEPE